MKKSLIFSAFLSLVLLCAATADAQSRKTRKADDAYDATDFHRAIELYKSAYGRVNDKKEKQYISYRMAQCAQNIGDYRKAENYYKRTVKMRYEDPIATLKLAEAQLNMGKFEDATENFQAYQKMVPGDKRAEKGLNNTNFAIEQKNNPTKYVLTNLKKLNSRGADFSPSYAKKDFKTLFFTTTREGVQGGRISDQTGTYYSDIWATEIKKDRRRRSSRSSNGKNAKPQWDTPVSLDELGNGSSKDGLNSVHEEGPTSLTPKANQLYFAKAIHTKGFFEGRRIYTSKRKGGGWEEGIEVEIPLQNVDSNEFIDFTHPAIHPNERTLFFVADLQGGYGGTDIWYSEFDRRKKKWTHPKNLGPKVNTAFNEAFPTVHADGTLFFSSLGHLGMGGYDIYSVKPDDAGNYLDVEHLGYPINSTFDDFGIIFKGNTYQEGILSSNRLGGRGLDDLYEVELYETMIHLEGKVLNIADETPLAQVNVTLEGSDGSSVNSMTIADGSYEFPVNTLKKGVIYNLSFCKDTFECQTMKFDTETISIKDFENEDGAFHLTFEKDAQLLEKKPIVVPIILPRIEYDFNKANLRPEAIQDLDNLVNVLNAHPSLRIVLRSHTDHIGRDEYNNTLSQQRAQACVDYLVGRGIAEDRLIAKGMGETEPVMLAQDVEPLKKGTVLTEAVISKLPRKAQDIFLQMNRRTDFASQKEPENTVEEEEEPADSPLDLGRY